jgi:hypothetical protein
MGMLSYFVAATAVGRDGTHVNVDTLMFDARRFSKTTLSELQLPPFYDEADDDEEEEVEEDVTVPSKAPADIVVALPTSTECDIPLVAIVSTLTSVKDPYVLTLNEIGQDMSVLKLFAYVTPSNCRDWSTILHDLHDQHPTLQLRLHYWYEEDMMTFLEVTPEGATGLVCVHAAGCRERNCCGYDCHRQVPYVMRGKRVLRMVPRDNQELWWSGLRRPTYRQFDEAPTVESVTGCPGPSPILGSSASLGNDSEDATGRDSEDEDDDADFYLHLPTYLQVVDDPSVCRCQTYNFGSILSAPRVGLGLFW